MENKKCIYCNKIFYKKHRGIEKWNKRKYCSIECSLNRSFVRKEDTYNWLGENVGYNALHRFIQRNFGKPYKCEHCGKIGEQGKRNWSIDWANVTGKYSRNKEDWKPLCRKCHIKYDKENIIENKKTVCLGNHNTVFSHEL